MVIFLQISFHYRLLQDIEHNFLCYTIHACGLPLLSVVISICCSHHLFPLPFGSKFVFYVWEDIDSFVLIFRVSI